MDTRVYDECVAHAAAASSSGYRTATRARHTSNRSCATMMLSERRLKSGSRLCDTISGSLNFFT
eukprot:COSAG01_NODE_23387_length_817_cov_0.930362_1_plen_64_part_00